MARVLVVDDSEVDRQLFGGLLESDPDLEVFFAGNGEEALASVVVRPFVTSWPTFKQGHGPALMAHPDFQSFLAKMNLDDASIAALEAGE